MLHNAKCDRAELSYTAASNRVLCAACDYRFYVNCQYFLVEGSRVNDCIKLCEIG